MENIRDIKNAENIRSVVCVAAILAMSIALQGYAHSAVQDRSNQIRTTDSFKYLRSR